MADAAKAYFIGHGSPFNLIQENPFTRDLRRLAKVLRKPRAVVIISAHWLTSGTCLTAPDRPEQIFDFYGFPRELYEVRYPAVGDAGIAKEISRAVPNGILRLSDEWGIDHAAVIPLIHMFPKADVPVVELSVDMHKPAQYHYDLGRALAPLRDEGIMFVGSGNLVHTFRELNWDSDVAAFPWAVEFDGLLKRAILAGDHKALIHYERWTASRRAFQTPDHYLPLLYIIGMQREGEVVTFVHEGFQHGSISHRSLEIG
jgi:4,5-DOPA dioxygenase extradiol